MTLTPAQRRLAKAMSERELQESIRDLCRPLRLLVQHYEDSLHGRCWERGDPDLRIYGLEMIHAELKREGEEPTAEQRRFGRAIEQAGLRWLVWKPTQLLSGEIAAELTGISPLSVATYFTRPQPTERTLA